MEESKKWELELSEGAVLIDGSVCMGLDDRNKGVEMTVSKVAEVRGLEDQHLH